MGQEARRCMVHTMRTFLVAYNVVFLHYKTEYEIQLTGIGLATVGFLMCTQYRGYTKSLGPDLSIIPMLLAVLGIMIIFASSLGILGALLSHSCLLVCYSGILLLLLLGEIALGCAAFTEQDEVEHKAEVGIVQIMAQYMRTNETRFGVDYVQRKFNCCGVTGYRDWQHVLGSTVVPESCCSDPEHCVRQYEDLPNGSVPPGVQTRPSRRGFEETAVSSLSLSSAAVRCNFWESSSAFCWPTDSEAPPAENFSTAHNRFRPSASGSSGRRSP
ncbi:hypothetical protein T265_02755 [Opisthorchis viverrini]|uniref:Uncharacterized protein n=1 Tax=Opisthorchis viverrini TaxID=6198 RepID=A0A075A5P3_OPIVI|nr:hypothetical protein T265_02755 [Opisthorchis viverrini]KER30945.1 hypothetical protein T265_02755 [Opisthorchis viverrini]